MKASAARFKKWMAGGNIRTARYRVLLAFALSRLGANAFARLRILLLVPLMPLRDKLGLHRPVRIHIRYEAIDVRWHLGPKTDADILNEILIASAYADLPIATPRVILDLGSHAGISLLHFRATYPEARVIGVEPNPRTIRRLRANAASLGVEVHQVAVTRIDGPTTLFSAEHPTVASLRERGEPAPVEGRTLDSLLDELGLEEVDLLKIDIEGGEFAAFRGSRRLADIRAITGEFHEYGDPGGREALFAMLNEFDVEVKEDHGETGTFTAVRRDDIAAPSRGKAS